MIPVNEAKELIQKNIRALKAIRLPLLRAAGSILAEDVFSQADIPSFDQSSMDGYAIRLDGNDNKLELQGVIPAGHPKLENIESGKAFRIFTGAPVPANADAVVMQEKTFVANGIIQINISETEKGLNIRRRGSDINFGSVVLKKGAELIPAAIGFLAGAGISEVSVIAQPRVTLIITGSELVSPGIDLRFGQVYESSSVALSAALKRAGVPAVTVQFVDDDPVRLSLMIKEALLNSELIFLTGGVSVGDYDFVVRAAETCKVRTVFHKVKQRPGKPLFFGMHEDTPLFGLPGNPSSVLTCFYEYVLPAIRQMTGKGFNVSATTAKLDSAWKKPAGLTHFLKGIYNNGSVRITGAQESYRMSSFATANCFVVLPEEGTEFEMGQQVEIHLMN